MGSKIYYTFFTTTVARNHSNEGREFFYRICENLKVNLVVAGGVETRPGLRLAYMPLTLRNRNLPLRLSQFCDRTVHKIIMNARLSSVASIRLILGFCGSFWGAMFPKM